MGDCVRGREQVGERRGEREGGRRLERDTRGARGPQLISVPRKEGGKRVAGEGGQEGDDGRARGVWKGFRFTQVY